MPRSRHIPMDDRPELTDETVALGLSFFGGGEPDAERVRDAIIAVLEEMDVAFVDKTDRSAEEEWAAKCAAIPAVPVDEDWIERTRAEAFGKGEGE